MTRHDLTIVQTLTRAGAFHNWRCSCGKRGKRPYYYRGLAEQAGDAHARTMISEKR